MRTPRANLGKHVSREQSLAHPLGTPRANLGKHVSREQSLAHPLGTPGANLGKTSRSGSTFSLIKIGAAFSLTP